MKPAILLFLVACGSVSSPSVQAEQCHDVDGQTVGYAFDQLGLAYEGGCSTPEKPYTPLNPDRCDYHRPDYQVCFAQWMMDTRHTCQIRFMLPAGKLDATGSTICATLFK